jgi:molybdopterin-biosynthesis enzyme MoeA-like protein
VNLAGMIRKWNEETVKVRKSVRDQLKAITDLGLNKYKMQKTELRKLTEEIFRYYGISESWLRKLLPEGLKDTSKTRLSYLQKQEMEKERQRLLQQKASESQQELESVLYYINQQ